MGIGIKNICIKKKMKKIVGRHFCIGFPILFLRSSSPFTISEVTLVVRRKYSYWGWRGLPAVYVISAQYQDRREPITFDKGIVHCMSGITGKKEILTFVFLLKYKCFIQTRLQSSAYCCCPSSLLDPWTGWVSLCLFMLPRSEKDFPQWGQSNGFSPVCDLWCILRWLDREKDFSQWGQSNGFSPVCDLWCLCKFADREKDFSHWEHLYAFSLLWVILCLCRLPDNEKDFWHCGQLYPFSPLWFIICLFRFSDNV